uniref:cytochrome ubiquinol oxidase subunit I n=1 Tax=Orrella sp. TaxID=1921583 RepID=UPI00404809E3
MGRHKRFLSNVLKSADTQSHILPRPVYTYAVMQISHSIFMQAQIAWAISLFQALMVLGLGLVWLLAVWQWLIGTTKQPTRLAAYESWLGVFAVVARAGFGFGLLTLVLVAVGWSTLFERAGNVLGPLLLVLTAIAFLTKTTVFSVMINGRGRVSEAIYSLSALATAFGYSLIVAGLVVIETWLRDPAGASLIDGRFQVIELRPIFFNQQVGLQALLTVLGAALATIGWMIGRQGLPSSAPGSDAKSVRLPASIYRLLCGLGLLAAIIVIVALDQMVASLVLDHGSLMGLLSGNLLAEPAGLSTGFAMVVTARLVALLLLTYLVLIMVAWVYGAVAPSAQRMRKHLTAGLLLVGPGLWAGLWLLLYLGKGRDVVVGHLTFDDVASAPSMSVLWVSAGLLAMASVGLLVALWQSLTQSLAPSPLPASQQTLP